MIKILHLITSLNIGGAEKSLLKLLSAMDRDAYANAVVSMLDKGELGETIERLGIPVYSLNMKRGMPNPASAVMLMSVLRRERPDVLQTWLYHADLLGILFGKLSGVPAIAWNIRCSVMDMAEYSGLSSVVLRMLVKFSHAPDVIIANSKTGMEYHESLGYRAKRWEIVYNGFDYGKFQPGTEDMKKKFRVKLGLPEDAFLFGMVARYDPMKDHGNLLHAVSQRRDDLSGVYFLLVGRGVDSGNVELNALVDRLGIRDKIVMLGERSDIDYITPALDAAVSSSRGEGFPNVIGEAMCCGIPCVATDVGDTSRLIGDSGLIVPPSEPRALGDAIVAMSRMDRGRREAMGKAARERIIQSFSMEKCTERYQDIYRSLGSKSRNS